MKQPVIFLDDGGVMNDNELRAAPWERLTAEFFVPRLGGTPQAWAKANRIIAERLLAPDNWRTRMQAFPYYAEFDRSYHSDWLGGMCELVGLPVPPEAECLDLAYRAIAFITPHVYAALPGVEDAIRTLHQRGYTLHTASGSSSLYLAGYLEGMGVRECFGRLYGPDLIDTFKEGPEYYERLFADVGVEPAQALVVDDSPRVIGWARQVGAQTALVDVLPAAETRATFCIKGLADLPGLIQEVREQQL